jgi:hypothetical protein
MFYFDEILGKKVVRSDLIKEIDCFFTTREFCIYSKTLPHPFCPVRNPHHTTKNRFVRSAPHTGQNG